MNCISDLYYMLGLAVVMGSGVVVIRKIRENRRSKGRMHDVGTNTSPYTSGSGFSVATQYGSCDSLDCVVTSPLSSEEEMEEMSLLSGASGTEPPPPKSRYWLNRWLW